MTARIALAFTLLLALARLDAAPIKPDEQVMFVPHVAAEQPDGRAALRIEAWVYEREPRRWLHWAFARYLRIDEKTMSDAERALFRERTQLFRVDSERGKRVQIALPDGRRALLPPTKADGRSSITLTIQPQDTAPWIEFSALLPEGDTRHFQGRALRVPARGWSVVSDIDDTIKLSQVLDQRELLLNTFVRPFKPVPGMAPRYRQFAHEDADTRFHYVSTSPLQLLPALSQFLSESGFPQGSMHLREATRWRDLLADDEGTASHKRHAIEHLLRTFPQRRFILIGDSGERDPEIYADLARRFPDQIALIAIRRVDEADVATRRNAVARDTGNTRWLWFDQPATLSLPDI